jgi:hypothetical protein
MTSEQPRQPDEAEPALVLRTQDGRMYAIPMDVLEAFRLSAEQEAEVTAGLPPADNDVQGYVLETQMSFNLLYLQLQSQMQHENRSYTALSNIMRTKHDTVKNSISNIR